MDGAMPGSSMATGPLMAKGETKANSNAENSVRIDTYTSEKMASII